MLSFTDMLVAVVVEPLFITFHVCRMLDCSSICHITIAYIAAWFVCTGWSLLTLAITALERYFSIEHPLRYHTIVTSRKLLVTLAVGFVSVAVGSVFLLKFILYNNYVAKSVVFTVFIVPVIGIISFCTIKVHVTAFCQKRTIAAQHQENQLRIKDYKRTVTIGIVLVFLVVLYSVWLILKIIERRLDHSSTLLINWLQTIWVTCVHLQSLLNPVIYSIRLHEIRYSILRKLGYLDTSNAGIRHS
jgi:hypothetical protein